MARENILIIDPSDIRRIRIVCSKCAGTVIYPRSGSPAKIPMNCPICNEEWWDGRFPRNDPAVQEADNLIRAIEFLSKLSERVIEIRLEVDASKE